MTFECILAKLSYLLGKKYGIIKIKQMMMQSLKGELTDIKKEQNTFSLKNSQMVQAVSKILNVTDQEDIKQINTSLAPLLVNSVTTSGNICLMKQLASEGADFTLVDYRGRAPIHVAAIKGDIEIVKFLIDLRVDLDQLDQQGMSALYMACYNRNSEAATLLNNSGANIIVEKSRLEKMLCSAGYEGDL